MSLSFDIVQWHAWAPGLAVPEDWQAWARSPFLPADLGLQPDVAFLPAMQRRRLTRLARMSFAAAWPLVHVGHSLPLVFGSSHGDTPLTYGLLQDLAREAPLSPTQFGLSVHNATAGQWSIQRADAMESCSIAAQQDGVEHAFIEACGLMQSCATDILVVLAEDAPAAPYRPWIADIPFPFAVAFRLTPGTGWELSLEAKPPAAASQQPRFGHALNVLRAFLRDERRWIHDCAPRRWTWHRYA